MSFARRFAGGANKPLPAVRDEASWTEERREHARAHRLAYALNAERLNTALASRLLDYLGRCVAVAGGATFATTTLDEAMAWIEATHPSDIGAFIAHVCGPDSLASGKAVYWEPIEETAAERERLLHERVAYNRNHKWLARQADRYSPVWQGKYMAVGGQEAIVTATMEAALTWLRANHADDRGAFVRYTAPY